MATASVVPSGGTTSLLLEREVQVAALRALITAGLIQAYPRRALLADRPPPRRQESQRRHRPLHPRDHLAPAVPPDARYTDLGAGFYNSRTDPAAADVTTFASSKRSVTRSPSSAPPDHQGHTSPGSLTLRRVLSRANLGSDFRAWPEHPRREERSWDLRLRGWLCHGTGRRRSLAL